MNISTAKKRAIQVIETFPKGKNRKPFLTLKNGKKCFFSVFIQKYGLDGSTSQYSTQVIMRRIRWVESFDHFTKHYDMVFDRYENNQHYYNIETLFFKFILVQQKDNHLEFLSFYLK